MIYFGKQRINLGVEELTLPRKRKMPRRLQLKVIIVEYFEVLDLAVASIKNRSGFKIYSNIEQLLRGAFLKAGVPLMKIDSFRELLEEHAFSLCGRQHLSEMIPFILCQEKAKIKEEIVGKHLSVIFGGTTRVHQ